MKNIYLILLLISIFSYSQDLSYEYTPTFGNHVIALEELNYVFEEGDLIGCFFINSNGFLQCCGSTVYEQGIPFVSAWPDDLTTDSEEGFIDGEQLILSFRLCDGVDYIYPSSLSYDSLFYETNGISTVSVTLNSPPDCSDLVLQPPVQSKEILKKTDILGQLIEENRSNQVIIILYHDGAVEKKFINR